MHQTTIQLDDETRRQLSQLAAWWGLPEQRHVTAVIQRMVEREIAIESARRSLTDADFIGLLAEMYRPIT